MEDDKIDRESRETTRFDSDLVAICCACVEN